MVVVRLKRGGAKRNPHYRIVAAESKNKRDGRNVEEIGYYHPCANPAKFEVKVDRLKHYLDKGAVMSDTVRNFVKKNRVLEQEG